MHAHPEPYVGQPSPGATIPVSGVRWCRAHRLALAGNRRPNLAADPSHDSGELLRYLRARPAGTLTPRIIDLSELPEPFTLRECIAFTGWSGSRQQLASALRELGYTAEWNGERLFWSIAK